MKILDQVGSLLSSLQGNQILKKITKLKDQGGFKSEVEFKQALKNNLLDITGNQDIPLFIPTPIVPGVAYSEAFNANIDDILLDLEVLFGEINYLFSKIKSHEVFFDRSVVEAEKLIINLNQNLESAKIEGGIDNAFNKVYHNSFIDSSHKVDFANPEAKEFYYDSRLKRRSTLDELCPIDVIQGKISLPKYSSSEISIAEAKILTTETTVSDFQVSFPGNDILKILSANSSDSWTHSILTKKQIKDGAKLVIELNLGDIKEFNSITLAPNASDPIFLEEIYTLDTLGTKHNFEIERGLIAESKTFIFPKRQAKAIYFSFKQETNKAIPYDPSQTITLAELQRDSSLPLTLDVISGQIKESIKDPSIKNVLGLEAVTASNSMLVYHYPFSIQKISIGNDEYKKKGIYVSWPETFKNLRQLALYVKETIPMTKHWETQLDIPCGAIEYKFFKKDYNAAGTLIKTSEINVLPIGTPTIECERLLFDDNRKQSLRFIGHKSDGDASTVEIYRNGELLIRGVDWRFTETQSNDPSDFLVDNNAIKTIIEIMHSNEQIYNGVYYAKYVPRFIAEPDLAVIDSGIRFSDNGSVITPGVVYGQEVVESDVYLQIIFRNNTALNTLSPHLDYYYIAGKEE